MIEEGIWTVLPGVVHLFFIYSIVILSCIHSMVHSNIQLTAYVFIEHLLCECGTVLDAGETAVNKVDSKSYYYGADYVRR